MFGAAVSIGVGAMIDNSNADKGVKRPGNNQFADSSNEWTPDMIKALKSDAEIKSYDPSLSDRFIGALRLDWENFTNPSLPNDRVNVFMKYHGYALNIATGVAGTHGSSISSFVSNVFRWERGAWGNPQGAVKLHIHAWPVMKYHLPYQFKTWYNHSKAVINQMFK